MSAVHLRSTKGYGDTACGQWKATAHTEDPGQVTCRSCEKAIESEMETIDEAAERLAPARARQTARGRAVKELQERHADEFQTLIDRYAAEDLDAARAYIRHDLEQRARWERTYVEKERARLEAELARLR